MSEGSAAEPLERPAELAAIVEAASAAIIATDLDDRITRWNRGAERIFGYTAREAVGRPASILIPADLRDERERLAQRMDVGAETSPEFETQRLTKDGRRIDVVVSASLVLDARGQLVGRAGVVQDVTELRAAERALRASEARYRMLVENAGDGILLMDPTTQVCLDGNPALLAMLGLEHDEIVGKLAVELIAPDELSRRPLDNSTLLREGRSVVERSLVTKRGEVLSVEAHASMLPGGLVQVIVRDLSERKRAEAMRARERGRLAELLEAAPDAVIVADHVGRVVLVNEQTRRLFGYPGEELLGVEVEQLLPQSRRADHVHARAAYVAEPSTRPMGAGRPSPGRRKDGSEFPAEVSLATIENEDGPLVLAFIRDVTERERREEAEREFIANAAHELRTPLAGIAGAVEALQLGASEIPAKRERFLEGIARETSRMTALVRALLLLARAQGDPESISRERVEVAPLLVETARRLELAPGVGVDVECTADLVILANRPLLEAAIGNLAQNASRHTSRGSITLAARVAPGAVSIEVRDTGEGMSDEVQARVFERFYRAGGDREGFGLGLPLVREMVRVLDGELELESQSQRGTTVRMIVPHLT